MRFWVSGIGPFRRLFVQTSANVFVIVSLGQPPTSALERLTQQTEVLVEILTEEGGPGALIDVREDFMQLGK